MRFEEGRGVLRVFRFLNPQGLGLLVVFRRGGTRGIQVPAVVSGAAVRVQRRMLAGPGHLNASQGVQKLLVPGGFRRVARFFGRPARQFQRLDVRGLAGEHVLGQGQGLAGPSVLQQQRGEVKAQIIVARVGLQALREALQHGFIHHTRPLCARYCSALMSVRSV